MLLVKPDDTATSAATDAEVFSKNLFSIQMTAPDYPGYWGYSAMMGLVGGWRRRK
ncbi:hypothetical protein [Sinorhizobium saheli]|uniref:hypothetical protein n=1 Tax=Sinorhizobium saheli TaxID=36856 RepID=UPI000B2030CD|nr:hypothetical protein [Sinorhizobium saheli]MQW89880.1 hypothetical protein [Sinorhizobium saheli]